MSNPFLEICEVFLKMRGLQQFAAQQSKKVACAVRKMVNLP